MTYSEGELTRLLRESSTTPSEMERMHTLSALLGESGEQCLNDITPEGLRAIAEACLDVVALVGVGGRLLGVHQFDLDVCHRDGVDVIAGGG